jgi:hypothetical protein
MILALLAVAAADLFHSYQQHPDQYPDKARVEVIGEVVQANTILGWRYFTFRTSKDEENVACILEKTDEQKERFKLVGVGKQVTASGTFSGHKDHIRLYSCRVEDVR